MSHIFRLLAIPVFAFLDRWGGGGFVFTRLVQEGSSLGKGFKNARRIGIPALVLVLNPNFTQLILCVALGAILSFNLKEIAERDWEEIFLHGFGIAAVLSTTIGYHTLIVPAVWLIGIYLSNIGIKGWKLGWHWVEIARGLAIGLTVFLS